MTVLAAGACWAALAGDAEGQTSAATDRAALEAFYDATGGGSQWSGANWKTAVPLGQWQGVSTSDQRVVQLSLRHDRNTGTGHLVGSLPGELGSLEKLERLYLDDHIGLTGPIPAELGSLANLRQLTLSGTSVTGPIPAEFGSLANLQWLDLSETGVSGPIPVGLGNLANLETLDLSYAWGLSGRLPPGLRSAPLRELDLMVTRACAPNEWRDWLKTIFFTGPLCDDQSVTATIDLAVVHTPAARNAAGGAAEIAALIDLLVAETNRAFAAGGVRHRVELVGTSEVPYVESGMHATDFRRLVRRDDGHLDEAHVLRDRVGADLVHLIVDGSRIAIRGVAQQPGPFSLTAHHGGGVVFAHELGHNLGLRHDRGEMAAYSNGRGRDDPVRYSRLLHPAYGWVNPQATLPDVADDRRWRTIMSYPTVCDDFSVVCTWISRFSNAGQSWNGDPLGAPFGATHSDGTSSAADAVAVLNAMGPAAALWRDHVNRAPVQAGWAENLTLRVDDAPAAVEMAGTFRDPDGDPLTCEAVSSAPGVAAAAAAGCTVTVTPVKADPASALVTVTATDDGGLSATQTFFVTVENSPPEARGALPALTIGLDDAPVSLEMAGAFRDPDGDPLILGAVSSAPAVAAAAAAGSAVTVTPVDAGTATVTVTATDAGGSNATAMQAFAVTVEPPNRPPEAVGALPAVTLGLDDAPAALDAAGAFRDPEGDPLTWEAVSSAPRVATATAAGSTVTVTPAGAGTTAVIVTATDDGGLSATQTFTVTVLRPFTDDPLRPGTTPIRAVHFTELRSRIDGLRRAAGLTRFGWTDPVLRAGVTRVRLVHLLELRQALGGAYAAAGRTPPPWTDAAPAAGALPVRAAHLTELRAAVVALERRRRTPGP